MYVGRQPARAVPFARWGSSPAKNHLQRQPLWRFWRSNYGRARGRPAPISMQNMGRIPTPSSAPATLASPLKICLVTCFPPSQGDLNEYGFHVASAPRNEPAVEHVLLADQTAAGQELQGFKVERCWRFDSFLTPVRLLAVIRKLNPDVVWFNMGFSTFARNPAAAFLSITRPSPGATVRLPHARHPAHAVRAHQPERRNCKNQI